MRILPVLLLASLAFAGCFSNGDDDTAPRELVGVPGTLTAQAPQEVWVVSSVDGKRIHNALYLPEGDGPFPVFINFSPYWGDTAMSGGDNFAKYLVEAVLPHGYAVVLSAIRGTGHSEGCFQIAGDLEVQDAYDVIDHFARANWSTGAVAAGGKSYDSTTQNGLIAKNPHPALKGIFHVSGITDMYRYNYVNGVPYLFGTIFTPRYYATFAIDEYNSAAEDPNSENQESLLRIVDDAACPEAPKHVASGTGSAAHGMKDDYWIERDWNRFIAETTWDGSIFFVHGFQDWNVKPDHILPWLELLPARIEQQSLIWLHQDTENIGHVYPMRDDWNATMLAWLDATLRDADNGIFNGERYQLESTDGTWHGATSWPPAMQDVPITWSSGGVRGATLEVDVENLTADGPVRITGAPYIAATVSGATAETVLTAIAYHNGAWVGEGVLRAMYDDGLDAPVPPMPLQTFDWGLYPLDVTLVPGDTFELQLGGQPRYALTTQAERVAAYHEPFTLELPLALPAPLESQPIATSCFAC